MHRAAETIWKINFVISVIKLLSYFEVDKKAEQYINNRSCNKYQKQCIDEFIEKHLNQTVDENYSLEILEFCCKEVELYLA